MFRTLQTSAMMIPPDIINRVFPFIVGKGKNKRMLAMEIGGRSIVK